MSELTKRALYMTLITFLSFGFGCFLIQSAAEDMMIGPAVLCFMIWILVFYMSMTDN